MLPSSTQFLFFARRISRHHGSIEIRPLITSFGTDMWKVVDATKRWEEMEENGKKSFPFDIQWITPGIKAGLLGKLYRNSL